MGEFYFKNYFLSEEEIEENKQNRNIFQPVGFTFCWLFK